MKTIKKLSILGSTGTIGKNALEVVRHFKDRLSVRALAADKNWRELTKQINEFKPELAVINDYESFKELKKNLDSRRGATQIKCGLEGIIAAAVLPEVDMVLSAVSGTSGILPTYNAVKAGKDVALANKESLVSAGVLIMSEAQRSGSKIIPVDSEHSAVFQLLNGKNRKDLKRIILPASGGPFLNHTLKELNSITVEDALNHPVWRMGRKITVDSATLANKGLEVIEAHHLFGMGYNKISVVIHPQCIIHGLLEMQDGATFAHMGRPDMKLPIAYAFFYPERPNMQKALSYGDTGSLSLLNVDKKKFPFLALAYKVGRNGKTFPAVFNAADEAAVNGFLNGEIRFNEIYEIVEETVSGHEPQEIAGIKDVMDAEDWGRRFAAQILKRKKGKRKK